MGNTGVCVWCGGRGDMSQGIDPWSFHLCVYFQPNQESLIARVLPYVVWLYVIFAHSHQ